MNDFVRAINFMVILFLPLNGQSVTVQVYPNILFVLTDDQPYDMLGFMGRYNFLDTSIIVQFRIRGEINNFINNSSYQKIRKKFMSQLDELKKEFGYTLNRVWRLKKLGIKEEILSSYLLNISEIYE